MMNFIKRIFGAKSIDDKNLTTNQGYVQDIPLENSCNVDDVQILKILEDRLCADDRKELIDAIIEYSNYDHPNILDALMNLATGAMIGEHRVAAAIGLSEYPSKKRIKYIEDYLNAKREGQAATGGDRKATAILILAIINGSCDLIQTLKQNFDGKSDVLNYYQQTEIPYKNIKNNIDQIGYLLAWCAAIDGGTGRRELINHIKNKVKKTKKLVDSVLKYM
jgi:hypothetical protein